MSTLATTSSAKALHLDVQGVAPSEVIPEALVVLTSSRAGFVEGDEPAVRVPFVNVDDDAGFVPEGTNIPEADPDTSETLIYTGKVAVLAKISAEQYRTGTASGLLSDAVRRALIKKANVAYLTQVAPGGGDTTPPAGLLNQSPTDGGTVTDNLDAVADAITTIEAAGGQATHIIASPTAWGELVKLKTAAESNVSLVGAGVEAPTRTLFSVPVLVTNAMTAYSFVVVDQSAVLSAYGQVQIATSRDFYFAADAIGLRATFRFGAKISDTERVVKLAVTEPGT